MQRGKDVVFLMNHGNSGMIDLGDVAREDVKIASEDGYAGIVRCLAKHVHVVRTPRGHYAKVLVTSIQDDGK